jgi:dolichol-phosphate mannosyltransferase
MKLSIIIPAYNESDSISETVAAFYGTLIHNRIDHEILVVNDHSGDKTPEVLNRMRDSIPTMIISENEGPGGFGNAVRWGLERFSGDCVVIVMADLSDSPGDLIVYYKEILKGYDCVFGTRWSKGGRAYDYPKHKYIFNRIFNNLVRVLFKIRYDDCTNAFKMYRKEVIHGAGPFLSSYFNFTIELPLKAIVRGYSYTVVPISWRNRKHGESNLRIKEMGSRYIFILIYCWIEKIFVRKSYKKSHRGN